MQRNYQDSFNEEVDFCRRKYGTAQNGTYISSLSKYSGRMLETDVIRHQYPGPQEEFDKEK
jgi:hypothetical protein